ncbi:MAG: glycogen synthase [Thermoanaerobaculia bacterium]|nr:glycogen synthase [Thermoanaerobaculia bacterium]
MTPVDFLRGLSLQLGSHRFGYSVFTTRLPGTTLDVYCINCPELYHRPGIYTGEWDEHLRYGLLSRAALECCQRMGWAPDVVHCNDWHTALVPLYLETLYGWDRLFAQTKTVLTIHNLAYQGMFPADVLGNLGLAGEWQRFHGGDLERGVVGFLKTGLLHADVVTTVSKTYAREIQTEAHGMGLDGLLRARAATVLGIVNGIDDEVWNPETDEHLPKRYSWRDVATGKLENKRHLLEQLRLAAGDDVPLLGVVSRLTAQKGFDLCTEVLPELLRNLDVRLVALGTGESRIEEFFAALQRHFPRKVCYVRGYSEALAHLIEAASDIFLMPSRFEPCGLNQMYSQRYGAVPVVHKTGGLADTVELYNWESGEGTGFVFDHFSTQGLTWALRYALSTFNHKEAWHLLRLNGMRQDFSWNKQGAEYEQLYARLAGRA